MKLWINGAKKRDKIFWISYFLICLLVILTMLYFTSFLVGVS